MKTETYNWSDNPTVSGVSICDTDVLNDCLMHLKYNNNKGDGLPLLTTMTFDHVLTGDEAVGWALAGSLVTMTYPDAVAKVVEEFNSGADETIRGIACKRASNGHLIADISQKDAIDALHSSTGVAEFYVLDSVNNQFYLPRNDWFIQGTSDPNKVNQFREAGLPNITGTFPTSSVWGAPSGVFRFTGGIGEQDGDGDGNRGRTESFDASRSSAVYGASSTVQPPSTLKLVYYKVGNTVVNESLIDVGNVLSDLQMKADIDAGNLTETGRSLISSLGMPSSRYENLTLKASGGTYTAPANGKYVFDGVYTGYNFLKVSSTDNQQYTVNEQMGTNWHLAHTWEVQKGVVSTITFNAMFNSYTFRFIYTEGAKND